MRVAVYTDYAYRVEGEAVYAERAFSLFLGALAPLFGGMAIVGREGPPGRVQARYALPGDVSFVPLPWYESLARPIAVLGAAARSIGRLWRALDDVDVVWVLGPHPVAIAFALLARLRNRRIVLGVRQELPAYARARHPGRRWVHAAADSLDWGYRLLARAFPTIVVGPALARRYARSRGLLQIDVSLVGESEIVDPAVAAGRAYDGELRVLSVGRLDEEKNPLLLVDVLARLAEDGRDWRLIVCGEGPLSGALRTRLAQHHLAARSDIRGYVRHDELRRLYRQSNFLLHSSWTEGFPQVIVEALAAGTPVVASDVGGIREAVSDAVALFPPGDPGAAVDAILRLVDDPEARIRLVEAGASYARAHTLEHETSRVADFIAQAG